MCTVTFIPKSLNQFILTSNRDEAPGRKTIAPLIYEEDEVHLLYPKDALAGGTWIGVSKRNRLICLLNGGFTGHQRADSYKMSRGVIVKTLLTTLDFKSTLKQFNFNGIEPFTIILIDWNNEMGLYQLVWDGENIHLDEKPWAPAIWSSSLLYTNEAKQLREKWFSTFIFDYIKPTPDQILQFHKTAGQGYGENAVIMDRGFVKTKSITQISKLNYAISMRYEDLQTKSLITTTF